MRYQYGISAAESQTFLLAKRPRRQRARKKKSAKKSLKTAYVFYLTNQNFVEQSEQVHGKKIPVDMSMSSLKQDKRVGRFMMRKQIHGQKHAKHVAINSHMKKCNKESVLFQIMYKTKGVLWISSDGDD